MRGALQYGQERVRCMSADELRGKSGRGRVTERQKHDEKMHMSSKSGAFTNDRYIFVWYLSN